MAKVLNINKAVKAMQDRIKNLEIIPVEGLPPSLQKRRQFAINSHHKALEDPQYFELHLKASVGPNGADDYIKNLNTSYQGFMKDWVGLLKDIEQSFIAELLQEYAGESYTVEPLLREYAEFFLQQDDNDKYPPVEMILEKNWAKKKLRIMCDREEHPRNDIQSLINAHDWPKVAAALIEDRFQVHQLFQGSAIDRSILNPQKRDKILHGIDEIEKKYSSELSKFSDRIADRKKLSVKQTSNQINDGLLTGPITSPLRNLHSAIATTSGVEATTLVPEVLSTFNTNADEKTLVVRRRKAW